MPNTTYTLRESGLLLLADAEQSGVGASSFTDSSGNGRTLAALNPKPIIEANVIGGKPAMKFTRTNNPLKYTGQMDIQCGWILAKSSANFLGYDGLLTALTTYGILVGNSGGNTFFDFGYDLYEYRSNDRIYPDSYRYAPIGAFKLIFFRFWKPLTVDGIQLGQDRSDATRRFDGYVAMTALYSTNYKCEQDIRKDAVSISNYYGLTLSDVYPYQGSKGDQKKLSKIILDDGQVSPVTIIKRGKRKAFDLRFTGREVAETDYFENFWDAHNPSRRFIYRDYDYVPPRDTMVNIKRGSEPELRLSGLAPNRFDYSMEVEESSTATGADVYSGGGASSQSANIYDGGSASGN